MFVPKVSLFFLETCIYVAGVTRVGCCIPHVIQVSLSDWLLVKLRFLFLWTESIGMVICTPAYCLVTCFESIGVLGPYTMFVLIVIGGGGGGRGFCPVVGWGSRPLLVVLPGGLPEWGHLSILGLGLGSHILVDVWCAWSGTFVFGSTSTIVLEGIV